MNVYNGVYDCQYPSSSPSFGCNRRFDPMTQRTSPKSRGNARVNFILDPDSPCPHPLSIFPPFIPFSLSLSLTSEPPPLPRIQSLYSGVSCPDRGIPPSLTLIDYARMDINILLCICHVCGHLMEQHDARRCNAASPNDTTLSRRYRIMINLCGYFRDNQSERSCRGDITYREIIHESRIMRMRYHACIPKSSESPYEFSGYLRCN